MMIIIIIMMMMQKQQRRQRQKQLQKPPKQKTTANAKKKAPKAKAAKANAKKQQTAANARTSFQNKATYIITLKCSRFYCSVSICIILHHFEQHTFNKNTTRYNASYRPKPFPIDLQHMKSRCFLFATHFGLL